MLAVHSKIARQLYRLVAEHKILVDEYRRYKCVWRHGKFWPLPKDVKYYRRYLLYNNPHVSTFDVFPDKFRSSMNELFRNEYPDAEELYFHARVPLEQVRKEMHHLCEERVLTSKDKVAIARHNLRRLRLMEECFQWMPEESRMRQYYNRFYNLTQL